MKSRCKIWIGGIVLTTEEGPCVGEGGPGSTVQLQPGPVPGGQFSKLWQLQ